MSLSTQVITPSSNVYLNAIQWGGWEWTDGAPIGTSINYFFGGSGQTLSSVLGNSITTSVAWQSYQQTAYRNALQTWANVANITFTQVFSYPSNPTDGLVEFVYSNSSSSILGIHQTPRDANSSDGTAWAGYNTAGAGFNSTGLLSGGYGFTTLVHEIGHGLGLAHPHDNGGGSGVFPGVTLGDSNDMGDNNLNQGMFTIMSYIDGWRTGIGLSPSSNYGWQATPMAFDIAAIQYLYGANTSYHSGANTYELGHVNGLPDQLSCIWDAGGTDTISYSGAYGCTIDLRAATLDDTPGGGGYVSYVNEAPTSSLDHWSAFTIANGVVIEKATGGSGNDTIRGNKADNVINGGSGIDTMGYTQNIQNYIFANLGSRILVSNATDGLDTLISIEKLQFANGTVTLTGNPLVDALYYDSLYLDVFGAGVDALTHFNQYGWREGRNPDAFFSTSSYLNYYKDVKNAGANPLDHYTQYGGRENRDPSANFSTELYKKFNPDVAAAGINPLRHWLEYGQAEGRRISGSISHNVVNGFDAQYYLLANPDVAAAGMDALTHFNNYGWREGRNPDAHFDTSGYLARYTDVKNAKANPLQHYMQYGWKEGRDPSGGFDTLGYLSLYTDVRNANMNPLTHYLQYGAFEGRQVVNDGAFHI